MLSAMRDGLKPSKLLWSLGKTDPKNFQELMNRVQKYANAKGLMCSRHSEISKSKEKRKKGPKQQQHPLKNKRNKNDVGGGTTSFKTFGGRF